VSKSGLRPRHLDGFVTYLRTEGHTAKLREDLRGVKLIVRQLDSWHLDMVVKLVEPLPPQAHRGKGHTSYSRCEFQRIASAARDDLRQAAQRIRANRTVLEQYRSGRIDDPTRQLELLDFLERHADVPRRGGDFPSKSHLPTQWLNASGFGGTWSIIRWAHLSPLEVSAGAVLLAALTGQNPYVIMKITATHHRAHGDAGGAKTAIVGVRKGRRGGRAEMDVALAAVPATERATTAPGRPVTDIASRRGVPR
jgi:hypothetical protein